MGKLTQLIFSLLLIFSISAGFSDDLYSDTDEIDDSRVLFLTKLQENKSQLLLEEHFTTNKKFVDIQQVAMVVSKITHLKTKIMTQSADKIFNITLKQTDGTVATFLDKAVKQFNYSWKLDANIIVFTAINPVVGEEKKTLVSESGSLNQSIETIKKPVTLWVLSPKIKTLRNALVLWSKRANWQLVWNVKADFLLTTTWSIEGTFEEAINQVLKASQSTDMPLLAIMHDNNKVLEIYSSVESN